MFHGLGDQPSCLRRQCRRDCRLRPSALENRERELQRTENHGYELKQNFGHGRTFPAMTLAALNLLAFGTLYSNCSSPWLAAREAAVKRTSFFAHILHAQRLRPLSVLADPPRIPRHLLNPAGPHKSQKQPVNPKPNPTFRIATGMPAKRELSMRQLRHLLRLHHGGVSARKIGRRLRGRLRGGALDGNGAAAAGLAWPLAEDVTDEALELRVRFKVMGSTLSIRRIDGGSADGDDETQRRGVFGIS